MFVLIVDVQGEYTFHRFDTLKAAEVARQWIERDNSVGFHAATLIVEDCDDAGRS